MGYIFVWDTLKFESYFYFFRMPKWPDDDSRAQFLCSNLRDRAINELSFDSKVQFWVDYIGQFCREKSQLSFTIEDVEKSVLESCPYRPTCLEAIIQNCNGSLTSKTDFETSLNWTSWSISVWVLLKILRIDTKFKFPTMCNFTSWFSKAPYFSNNISP